MKTKINLKTLPAKLNRSISAFVKSATDTNSKKINKSIKKASKIVAKAITKAMNKKEMVNSLTEKFASKKIKANKYASGNVRKGSSSKSAGRKIKKTDRIKVAKLKEAPIVTSELKTPSGTISTQ